MFQAKIKNQTIVNAKSFNECVERLKFWQQEYKVFKIYLNDKEYCTFIPKEK